MPPRAPLRIAYISQAFPIRNGHGGNVYCHEILRFLVGEGHDVQFLWLKGDLGPAQPWIILAGKFDFPCPVWTPGGQRLGPLLLTDDVRRRPWRGIGPTFRKLTRRWRKPLSPPDATPPDPADAGIPYPTPAEIRWTGETLARLRPDVTIVDYTYNARLFQRLPPPAWPGGWRVVVAIDLLHRRGEVLRGLDGHVSREAEAALLGAADAVTAIQREEAAEIREMAPGTEVITVPCPILGQPVTGPGEEGHCLLVGGGARTNVWGLEWLLAHVWPTVLREVPAARLTVCGDVCRSLPAPGPEQRCRFVGRVKDLRPYYERASLCLIPILSGTGMRIKLVEALGYRRPMVTTTFGVQGFPELAEAGIVPVADDPEAFAAQVVSLLTSRERRERDRDRQAAWAKANLSPEAVFAPFLEYLARVAATPR